MNYLLSCALISLALGSLGCKHDLVTAHLTIRNKDAIALKGIVIEFDGRQKRVGNLNSNSMAGYGFAKLPRSMKSLTIIWTIDGGEKRAEINVPVIPNSDPPPQVIITYADGGWGITVGYEKPPGMRGS